MDIDQGIHKVKLKVALNEKRKKLPGFSFSINMANFEAFRWTKKLISNLFFLKSVYVFYFPTNYHIRLHISVVTRLVYVCQGKRVLSTKYVLLMSYYTFHNYMNLIRF